MDSTFQSMTKSYHQFLKDNGLNEAQMRAALDNAFVDETPHSRICVLDSAIEGKGIFAVAPIKENECISPLKKGCEWTLVGRFTNHCASPNTVAKGNMLVAACDIEAGDELVANYYQVKAQIQGIV